MKTSIIAAACAILLATAIACSTSTTPKTCGDLVREKGVPETIIKAIERPEELNAAERIAVHKALEGAGLEDACASMLESRRGRWVPVYTF